MWEIFEYGKVPYGSMSNSETASFVTKGGRLKQPASCPDGIFKLMNQCWNVNPSDRPTFKSLHSSIVSFLSGNGATSTETVSQELEIVLSYDNTDEDIEIQKHQNEYQANYN